MKILVPFLTGLSAFLFGGCSSHDVSMERHASRLAPALGVDASEIRFVSRGELGAIKNLNRKEFQAQKGTVVLTESDLCFVTRHARHLFSRDVSSLPLNEFEGVALVNSQIQLKHRKLIFILQLEDASTPQESVQQYEDLYHHFLSMDIPAYETTTAYVRTGYLYGGLASLQQNETNPVRRFNSNPNRHLGPPHSGGRYVPPR